jgi:RNA polymerase sigma-70 factor (ECF subfamily)
MKDEKQLIRDVLNGERNAFSDLIERYKKLVSHIVFKIVKSSEDREDIAQDVFVKVYQNLADFNGDCRLSSWIGRIAYNTSLNHLGKKRKELWEDGSPDNSMDSLIDGARLPDEMASNSDIAARMRGEISQLPAPYNLIITLFHLDEMSYQEIYEITGMPEGTVKSYLFRARRELKRRLERKYCLEDWKS